MSYCKQMTKTNLFAVSGGGDHVADLHLFMTAYLTPGQVGVQKVRLQHVATAVALNVLRTVA